MRNEMVQIMEETTDETLAYYVERVQELLTAECAVEESSQQCVVKPQKAASKSWFDKFVPALFKSTSTSALYHEAKRTQFVQLSQFEGYTNDIVDKLQAYAEVRVVAMKAAFEELVDEFLKPWSRWLTWNCDVNNEFPWTPVISTPQFVTAAKVRVWPRPLMQRTLRLATPPRPLTQRTLCA